MLYPIENEFRDVKNLNGTWDFKVDFCDEGFTKRWQEKKLEDSMPMAVPASYNDLVTDVKIKEHVGFVWYQRKFVVPYSWEDKRVVLRFGSVTHHATVFVDGTEVAKHKGGFLPFEADITGVITVGKEHLLTVAVSNVLDWTCLPCGEIVEKNDLSSYPEGYRYQETFFDFYNYAGIHRPVKLYTTSKTYIKDITIKTNVINGKAEVDFDIEFVGKPKEVSVSIKDSDGMTVAFGDVNAGVKVMSLEEFEKTKRIKGTLYVDNPILWEPGRGYLYKMNVETKEDKYTEEFGIREVKVVGDMFLINGKPFYFKGFGKHEDSDIHGRGIDEALNIKDFNLLKWIGANSIRTSHYPYSEELMKLADREGLVVIDEVPAVGMCFWDGQKVFGGNRVNDETLAHHLDTLQDIYDRDKNHPCVVMWSVANEAATYEKESVPYFTKVIDKMRSLDNTRPVTMVHTSPAESDLVSDMLDVICVNRYYGWYTDHSHIEVIEKQLEKELNQWYKKYRKPLIMTEYGADTIAGLHKLPAVSFSEEFQCEYLDAFHKVFDKCDFVIGEHVWNFADFATKQGLNRIDGNKKGVFTRQRQPKMSAFMLQKRWTSKR